MYLGKSLMCKCEVVILDYVESFQTVLYGLNRDLYNLYETGLLIISSSNSGVKFIGLNILGFSLVNMETKAGLIFKVCNK